MNAATKAVVGALAPAIKDALADAVGKRGAVVSSEAATAVTKEIAAVVVNQTNTEPFYQSRVTIGAIMTLIGGTYALVLDFMDGVPPSTDDLTAQATAIIGAGVVLYGRWIAKKPIGQ